MYQLTKIKKDSSSTFGRARQEGRGIRLFVQNVSAKKGGSEVVVYTAVPEKENSQASDRIKPGEWGLFDSGFIQAGLGDEADNKDVAYVLVTDELEPPGLRVARLTKDATLQLVTGSAPRKVWLSNPLGAKVDVSYDSVSNPITLGARQELELVAKEVKVEADRASFLLFRVD